jgi:hypothetical protein
MPENAIVPVTEYAIVQSGMQETLAIIRQNVGAAGLKPADLDRIKLPTGGVTNWSVPGLSGDESAKDLTGIIVHWNESRRYWADKYGAGHRKPPDCASNDCIVGKGNPGGECSKCPLAEFGTAKDDAGNEGAGQACKQVRTLFLIRASDFIPVVVSLPATSLRPCRNFFLRLASKRIPFYGVVCKLALHKERNAKGVDYAAADFTMVAQLAPEQVAVIEGVRKAIMPDLDRVRPDTQDEASE